MTLPGMAACTVRMHGSRFVVLVCDWGGLTRWVFYQYAAGLTVRDQHTGMAAYHSWYYLQDSQSLVVLIASETATSLIGPCAICSIRVPKHCSEARTAQEAFFASLFIGCPVRHQVLRVVRHFQPRCDMAMNSSISVIAVYYIHLWVVQPG